MRRRVRSWPGAGLLDLHPTFGPQLAARAPRGFLDYLAQFRSTRRCGRRRPRSLGELVGSSHILFGSDYPFAPEIVAQVCIDQLASYDGFDAAARRLIERDDAWRCCRAFASVSDAC